MLNLLNTIVLFGKEFEWPLENALFWLLIVQVALIMFMVIVFAVLIKRVGHSRVTVDTKPTERTLQGISLDLTMVKRNFEVGEEFSCDGLLISANYNLDPVSEPITEFAVITQDQLNVLQKDGPVEGCYILIPDMSAEGKVTVSVNYHGQQAAYAIAVGVQPQTVAQPIAVPVVEYSAVAEERTLTGLELDLGVVQREFTAGDEFNCDGLIITAKYNFSPKEEIVTDYTVIDQEVFDGTAAEELNGCYVIKPNISEAGKVAVTVRYHDRSTMYMVVVKEAPLEEIEETPVEQLPEQLPERKLIGITLDLSLVQREFTEGDEFNCDGLIVNADFDLDPITESLFNYSIVDEAEFEALPEDAEGCYVIKPDLTKTGKQVVSVRYEKLAAYYTIAVEQAAAEVEEEPEQLPERKLIGITLDFSLVQREFTVGDEFNCDGLIINANYDSDPITESLVEYSVVDEQTYDSLAADVEGCYVIKPDLTNAGKQIVTVRYEQLTSYYTIAVEEPKEEEKPERVLLYITVNTDAVRKDFEAGETFTSEGLIVTAHFNTEPLEAEIENYSIAAPDMNVPGSPNVSVQYQDRTVGYRINIAARPEEPEVIVVKRDPIVIEEESYEGVLRYDKSFTARFIQSDDEIKIWYTKLKNELLSYKKVKARMSWKRETYRYGRDTVARLGFRGNTLCIFLPLNAADYEDSRFKVEDVSDSPSYVDTPCMYRLKNEKRIRLAIELFETVMEKYGAQRIERDPEDYYLPYEGIVQLINKGLARRVIKNKEDEAIFLRDAAEGEGQQPDGTPADAPAEQPAETPAEQPVEQIAETKAEQPVETPVEETTAQVEQPAETPAEEQAPEAEPAQETAEPEQETAEPAPETEPEQELVEAPIEEQETPVEPEAEQTEPETAPAEEAQLEEVPAEETPIEETPAEETVEEPAEETPSEEPTETTEEPTEASEPTETAEVPEETSEEPAETLEETSEGEAEDDADSDEEEGERDFTADKNGEREQHRWNGKNRKKHKVRR